jgi:mRNA-degrading endonuclease RelE of RelBE toxin-antitoxin system
VKIRRTNSFLKDYRKLPEEIKPRVDKQLSLLLENPRHPSLRLNKLKGTQIFEIRINGGYRLTISYGENVLVLRRVGIHDVPRKEA